MAGTAREADTLKELAGVSSRGRKLDKPVYHFSLSWAPGERPDRAGMLDAARSSLKSLGMDDRQAVIVEHTDRRHRHVHVVVNRVSAEDGRASSRSHDARKLSRWAHTWEREHDSVRCHRRQPQALERVVDTIKRVFKREPSPVPEPAPQRSRRCPGRRDRSESDRREWARLYDRQRAEPSREPSRERAERCELNRQQREQVRLAAERRAAAEIAVPKASAELHRHRTYYSDNDRVRDAADAAEARLPKHPDPDNPSQRTLAVSDAMFDRLSDAIRDPWSLERHAIAAVRARHSHDAEARARAEQDYHRPTVERECERLRKAYKSAWRCGLADSPEPEPGYKTAAEASVLGHYRYAHLQGTFRDACRSVERQRWEPDRDDRHHRAAPEQSRGRDDDYGPER